MSPQLSPEHVTDGGPCWCAPKVYNVCPECDDQVHPDPECWRCDGLGMVAQYDESLPVITLHNDVVL